MVKTASTMLELGTDAPTFSLPNIDGNDVSLSDFQSSPLLVMFICNHCPFVKHLADHLATQCKAWQDKGVQVVAISSNDVVNYPADSPEAMKEEHQSRGYTFPYLFDESQEVAIAYRAACTPDFFLFDQEHRLVYRGQYDSSRPGNDVAITGEDLNQAIEQLIAGEEVPATQMPSIGCNIKWKEGKAPQYFDPSGTA